MILKWVLVGLVSGSLAKMITSHDGGGSWLASLGVGVMGAVAGGYLFDLFGFHIDGLQSELIAAVIGSVILLFLYHRYKS